MEKRVEVEELADVPYVCYEYDPSKRYLLRHKDGDYIKHTDGRVMEFPTPESAAQAYKDLIEPWRGDRREEATNPEEKS